MVINGITLNYFQAVIEHAKEQAEKYNKAYFLTAQKLKGLWRKVAIKVHPDKGGLEEDYKQAQNEYQDLLDSLKKNPDFTAVEDSPEAYDNFTEFLASIHPIVHETFRAVLDIKGINVIDVVGWYVNVKLDKSQVAERESLKKIEVNGTRFKWHKKDLRWYWAGVRAMGVPMSYEKKKQVFGFQQYKRKGEDEPRQLTA